MALFTCVLYISKSIKAKIMKFNNNKTKALEHINVGIKWHWSTLHSIADTFGARGTCCCANVGNQSHSGTSNWRTGKTITGETLKQWITNAIPTTIRTLVCEPRGEWRKVYKESLFQDIKNYKTRDI